MRKDELQALLARPECPVSALPATGVVTFPEPPLAPPIEHRRERALPRRVDRKQAPEAPAGQIIRRQVLRLIGDILSDTDIPDYVRLRLLKHVSEHPGNPEQAMLAQVNDWRDDEGPS